LWSGGIETVEMFDQVRAAEVVVRLPSVFASVIAFPFDQVFHAVVVEAAVQNGFNIVFRNSVQEGGQRVRCPGMGSARAGVSLTTGNAG
jgi:hypothetical protein